MIIRAEREPDLAGESPRLPPRPPQRAYRRITRNGNSLTVSIPKIFLRTLHLLQHDELELVLDREWGGFFVRKRIVVPPPPTPPIPKPPTEEQPQ